MKNKGSEIRDQLRDGCVWGRDVRGGMAIGQGSVLTKDGK